MNGVADGGAHAASTDLAGAADSELVVPVVRHVEQHNVDVGHVGVDRHDGCDGVKRPQMFVCCDRTCGLSP